MIYQKGQATNAFMVRFWVRVWTLSISSKIFFKQLFNVFTLTFCLIVKLSCYSILYKSSKTLSYIYLLIYIKIDLLERFDSCNNYNYSRLRGVVFKSTWRSPDVLDSIPDKTITASSRRVISYFKTTHPRRESNASTTTNIIN